MLTTNIVRATDDGGIEFGVHHQATLLPVQVSKHFLRGAGTIDTSGVQLIQ